MAVLGLLFCARAPSSCSKRGPLFIAVRRPLIIAARRPLIIAASLVAEHRLQTRRLSSCGSRAQLLRGMWDLPRPGPEPASPALAGRFSTTAPPGKPCTSSLFNPWVERAGEVPAGVSVVLSAYFRYVCHPAAHTQKGWGDAREELILKEKRVE